MVRRAIGVGATTRKAAFPVFKARVWTRTHTRYTLRFMSASLCLFSSFFLISWRLYGLDPLLGG